jgi:hypothetical protein
VIVYGKYTGELTFENLCKTLVLCDLLDLELLPDGIGLLTALRTLSLSGCCEVTKLPVMCVYVCVVCVYS